VENGKWKMENGKEKASRRVVDSLLGGVMDIQS